MTLRESAAYIADGFYARDTVRWGKLFNRALRQLKYHAEKAERREILSNMAESDADLLMKGY